MDVAIFGLKLVAVGLTLVLVTLLLRAVLASLKKYHRPAAPHAIFTPKIPANTDAVLIIQPGGRVAYFNQQASEWLGYNREKPTIDIDRLARRAHPSDAFLELCYAEGQAHFSLDGRMVEGTSHTIPFGSNHAVLVSLRRPQVEALRLGGSEASDQTFNIFAELSQSMVSSLQLETTISAILDSVERLIPSDFSEITVWDPENKQLIPYHFVGQPGIDRHLERASEHYTLEQGYSGYLVTRREPLRIVNVDTFRNVRPIVDRKQYPFNSYAGVPLVMASEVLGTLELAALSLDAFSENDLALLQMLSRQATIALHNALLYQTEQHRIRELSGLAELARAVGTLHHTQDLFTRLVDSISPLLDVSVVGFMIYNENQRSLEARAPFVGIPPQFLQLYRTSILPGSPAEGVWLKRETIHANNAPEDPRLLALNLAHLAQAVGIMRTIMAPLTSSGRGLGYLQVADKKDKSFFDANDLRLLEIIAGQSATIIENASLLNQSQERAQRAEALRRIASLTGSTATLDEILRVSLRELARLFRADMAAILLIDETLGVLRLHEGSWFGKNYDPATRTDQISISDPLFRETVTFAKQPFFTEQAGDDPKISTAYQHFIAGFSLQSLIDVPLIVRDTGIGEILLGSRTADFFEPQDMSLVSTTASQLAAAIEKSSLYTQTDENLRRRVEQLSALNHISRELNITDDIDNIVKLVYDEVLRVTQASCGTILLFGEDGSGSSAVKTPLSIGDAAGKEFTALEHTVIEKAEPIIIRDYGNLAKASISWQPPHQGVLSSMTVPIAFKRKVAGLIHLHSQEVDHFDTANLEYVQSLAIQAAIAIENSNRYHEQTTRNKALTRQAGIFSHVHHTSRALQLDRSFEDSLKAICEGIQKATPFRIVLISKYDPAQDTLVQVTGTNLPIETTILNHFRRQPWEEITPLLTAKYQFNGSFFIPYDQSVYSPSENNTEEEINPTDEKGAAHPSTWHPDDQLLAPLFREDRSPLGLIRLDAPRDGRRPDRATFETLDIFSSQVTLILDSQDKAESLSMTVETLRTENERTLRDLQAAQKKFPEALEMDADQALTLQQINQQARRIHAGLDIAGRINQQPDRARALLSLGQEIVARLELDTVLVAESTPGGLRLLHTIGEIPANVNPEVLLGQRNPIRHSLQTGEMLLVPDLEASEWQNTPLLGALNAKSFLCLPIPLEPGPNVEAVVLASSPKGLPVITPEDVQIYGLITRQAAMTLENLRLQAQTNRRLQEVNLLFEFSRQLGSLDTGSILQALVDSALRVLPEAQAAMVALWKPDQDRLVPQIASGYVDNQRILGISYRVNEALPGKSFAQGDILRLNEIDFARDYDLPSESLLDYRDATGGRLPVSNLIVPIQSFENKLGVLVLDNFTTPAAFTPDDQTLIASLAQQTVLALENASLFAETQRLVRETQQRTAELATLYELGMNVSQVLDQRRLIELTLENVTQLLHAESVVLVIRNDPDGTLTIDGVDRGERIGPLVREATGKSYSEHVMIAGRPVLVGDMQDETQRPPVEGYNIGDPARSWLGVPVVVRGIAFGALSVQSYQPYYFNETHERLLSQVTNQFSIAYDNARLFTAAQNYTLDLEARVTERTRQVENEHQRTQALLNIITELSSSLDLDLVLNRTLAVINQAMGATYSLIMLLHPDTATFYVRAALGYASPPQQDGQGVAFKPADSLIRWVIENRQPIFIPNLLTDSRWIRQNDQTHDHRGAIIVPLLMGEEVLGVLLLFSRKEYDFSDDQLELAQAAAKQITVSINNAQLYRLTREQAERLGEMLRTQHIETSRSQAILEAVADGVLVTDVVGKITLFNASAEKVLGLNRGDILGQSLEHFIGLFGKAAQSWMTTIRTWMEDPEAYKPGDTYAEQIILDNRKVVSVQLSPVRMRTNFLGTVSIFRDITHQVEVDRLKTEFVATVSHELRTPMTSIKGYVEILLMGAAGSMTPQQVHFLDIVRSNTERLSVLVNDLLDVSRIEAGRVTLVLQALDLREIAEEVVATLFRRMKEENRPMSIDLDLPSALPRVWGDAERVRQILDNLVENAYQYTEVNGTILLKLRANGDVMQIDIQDTGIGIPPEEHKRVFERFYRGEDPLVLENSGTGLGLSIVKYLVEMHNGRIWLESSGIRGEGSTFSFTLPLYQSPEPTQALVAEG